MGQRAHEFAPAVENFQALAPGLVLVKERLVVGGAVDEEAVFAARKFGLVTGADGATGTFVEPITTEAI